MFDPILQFSLKQRWLILVAVVGVVALGVYNFQRLPIDAVPDITNVQIQVNTNAAGYSPLEVEQRITFPMEIAMAGLPSLENTRSLSRYGLSQITIIFKEGTNIYWARQLVGERLQSVELPPGAKSDMGPITTGLGEIYIYSVDAKSGSGYTSTDLRTVQDWMIRPLLRNVPGVNEVNTIGGYEKQFHITPHPDRLLAYSVTFENVLNALERNNNNAGAGYIEKNGEQYLVRAPGQVLTIPEIENIVVGSNEGVPIRIKDVASVGLGKQLRTGAATLNGQETVIGTTMMLIGENSRTVSQRVDTRLKEINKTLPPGIQATPIYNRETLVDATIATVEKNLTEGATLVIVILFLLLGNIRAAILTAAMIPLAMVMTISGMANTGLSGNLMSLGELDFGIIIDGAVVIVENCIRRLAEEQKELKRLLNLKERLLVVFESSKEVIRPGMFGSLIIMIVYLPILSLSGIEGKMFKPMALTVIYALAAAMILSMTFVPAACAIWDRSLLKLKRKLRMM
jgi:heavy metal efflux system protein